MFTGLIEHKGQVVQIHAGQPLQLVVHIPNQWGLLDLGASVAVNGCCLTVVSSKMNYITVDVGKQSSKQTTLANLSVGDFVNLERPMRLGDRFDGHMVLGHVDGTGIITAVKSEQKTYYMTVTVKESLVPFIAPQGSITVDGVSLTVTAVDHDSFCVAIIPHTWQQTIMAKYIIGSQVNIEVDVLARYVHNLLIKQQQIDKPHAALSVAFLQEKGFA